MKQKRLAQKYEEWEENSKKKQYKWNWTCEEHTRELVTSTECYLSELVYRIELSVHLYMKGKFQCMNRILFFFFFFSSLALLFLSFFFNIFLRYAITINAMLKSQTTVDIGMNEKEREKERLFWNELMVWPPLLNEKPVNCVYFELVSL